MMVGMYVNMPTKQFSQCQPTHPEAKPVHSGVLADANLSLTLYFYRETPMTRVWFKQDDEFLLPKADFNVEFCSPMANLTPHHANMTAMIAYTLKDALKEHTYYDAQLAGLYYILSNNTHGINFYIWGYSQKQHILLEKVLEKLCSFKVDEGRFEVLKEAYGRALRNFKMDAPYQQQGFYFDSVMFSGKVWQNEELLDVLKVLTVLVLKQ